MTREEVARQLAACDQLVAMGREIFASLSPESRAEHITGFARVHRVACATADAPEADGKSLLALTPEELRCLSAFAVVGLCMLTVQEIESKEAQE